METQASIAPLPLVATFVGVEPVRWAFDELQAAELYQKRVVVCDSRKSQFVYCFLKA